MIRGLIETAQSRAVAVGHQRLTDGQGRTVDFTNALIVMTSNLGSDLLSRKVDSHGYESICAEVMESVRRSFRPEFLNRVDEIILFEKLNLEQITEIIRIQLGRLQLLLDSRKT